MLSKIVEVISAVPGIKAIALGGSRSRNEDSAASDYDIGLYYEQEQLDLVMLDQCLATLDDSKRCNLLNAPGQWGPWINGGAWLIIDGVHVDFLLREIKRVETVLKDCLTGNISIDYQCGHPFAFVNTIYAAETHYSQPLWEDPSQPLLGLKTLLYSEGEYPRRMKKAIIERFLWEAEFSLACGRSAAFKGDINYAIGSIFRTVCSWLEVLYALNDHYLMNEKGALSRVSGLTCCPPDMNAQISEVYKLLAADEAKQAYHILEGLQHEIESIIGSEKS